jgi:hypothetical protein
MKWMYFIGLLITAADILIALGLTQSWVRAERAAVDKRRPDPSHVIAP